MEANNPIQRHRRIVIYILLVRHYWIEIPKSQCQGNIFIFIFIYRNKTVLKLIHSWIKLNMFSFFDIIFALYRHFYFIYLILSSLCLLFVFAFWVFVFFLYFRLTWKHFVNLFFFLLIHFSLHCNIIHFKNNIFKSNIFFC